MSNANNQPLPPAKMKKVARRKDYWGATPVAMSLLILVLAVVGAVIAVSVVTIINLANGNVNVTDAADAEKLTAAATSSPLIILASTIPMYLIWLGCELWVTKYRSQLGTKFKTFWAAFKDNFFLRAKWWDPFLGIGIGLAFVVFQTVLLWLIPTLFPSFDIKDSDNTGIFADQSGIWFYILGFGLVSFLGPIMEELYFRGFVLHGLVNHFSVRGKGSGLADAEDQLYSHSVQAGTMFTRYHQWTYRHRNIIAVTLTALLFGAFHFQSFTPGGILTCLVTASLGFINGLLTLKLNRITPAVFSHITNNTVAMILLAIH
jgi:membrane protease YdiL (CAAX protease family)